MSHFRLDWPQTVTGLKWISPVLRISFVNSEIRLNLCASYVLHPIAGTQALPVELLSRPGDP